MSSTRASQRLTGSTFALLACLMLGSVAHAGAAAEPDVLLPGTSLSVVQKKVGGTQVKVKAKAAAAFALPAGDPTVSGAQVVLADDGTPGSEVTLTLPAAGWKGLGKPAGAKGWSFKGGPLDACASARITPKLLTLRCTREAGWLPAEGEIDVVVAIGAKRYCTAFGGAQKKNDALRLKRVKAPAPVACPAFDLDGDGISDVLEIGPDPESPLDLDGDLTPDYLDPDSDGDGISDLDEGTADFDGDGAGNWRDTDSDDDCRGDALESGGTTPPSDADLDGRPDFADLDSDGDRLSDEAEDANCDGVRDGSETDARGADADEDGASDLIEVAAGSDPNDPVDNPDARGDLVFVVEPDAAPAPADDALEIDGRLRAVDLYVILDRSGSMLAETTSIKNGLASVMNQLTCPPVGTGNPATCIPDLWAGAGTVGYSGASGSAFLNALDVQPTPNFSGVPTSEPPGCCSEPLNFSIYSAITGFGTAAVPACGIANMVASRATCAGSPAANAGFDVFGYPCFRSGALPVIVLATDEPPISAGDTNKCPNWHSVVLPEMGARAARFVGVARGGSPAAVVTDLQTMATGTGAVDAGSGNAPLVFVATAGGSAVSIQTAISTLATGLPLDLGIAAEDDGSDAVDAVAAFVDRLETLQLGTAGCTNGLTDFDTNVDGHPDAYADVRVGTPVCWRLVPKSNTTVAETSTLQSFKATVRVSGDGVTEIDARDVHFVVPPALVE